MEIIQVIGLPGAGKSTGIIRYLSRTRRQYEYIDIANYNTRKEQQFKHAILNANLPVIAESAQGLNSIRSFTVKVDPPIQCVYERVLKRDGVLDEDYMSLIRTTMTRAHVTVQSTDELTNVLKAYEYGRRSKRRNIR